MPPDRPVEGNRTIPMTPEDDPEFLLPETPEDDPEFLVGS